MYTHATSATSGSTAPPVALHSTLQLNLEIIGRVPVFLLQTQSVQTIFYLFIYFCLLYKGGPNSYTGGAQSKIKKSKTALPTTTNNTHRATMRLLH